LARKSELLKARWQEIDFEAGEWQMRAKNAKNTMPHVVYLSRQAKALFLELKALAGVPSWYSLDAAALASLLNDLRCSTASLLASINVSWDQDAWLFAARSRT
jgi:integrase